MMFITFVSNFAWLPDTIKAQRKYANLACVFPIQFVTTAAAQPSTRVQIRERMFMSFTSESKRSWTLEAQMKPTFMAFIAKDVADAGTI